jgi:hypothetical protein
MGDLNVLDLTRGTRPGPPTPPPAPSCASPHGSSAALERPSVDQLTIEKHVSDACEVPGPFKRQFKTKLESN